MKPQASMWSKSGLGLYQKRNSVEVNIPTFATALSLFTSLFVWDLDMSVYEFIYFDPSYAITITIN
jgi:hypothetical protein